MSVTTDNVAPNAEHINQQDCNVRDKCSKLFGCFDPGKNKQYNQYDLLDDTGIFPRSNDQEELVVKRLPDDDYRRLCSFLECKPKRSFIMCYIQLKQKRNLWDYS